MILAFELTWSGLTHAPGNSATIQTIAHAFPAEPIQIFADRAHLIELKRDGTLPAFPRLSFHQVATFGEHRGKTYIVSPRRLYYEASTLFRAIRCVPHTEPCLVVLLSATPTAIFAASWLLRLFSARNLGVHVILHGNANDIHGWRSRNPVLRRFDLTSALSATHPERLRFVVLEKSIRTELETQLPKLRSRIDVLANPVNTAELPAVEPRPLGEPVKVGFVGLATEAKGIDPFLRVAAACRARYRDRVEFYHVGRVPDGVDLAPFSVLSQPASRESLSREEFMRRITALHYVMVPYRPGYYNLSASGALVDAVTYQKPIIATALPMVTQVFEEFGDIGYLCSDEGELVAAVDAVMALDEKRYASQIAALAKARDSRLPDQLARTYREAVLSGYPGLFQPAGTR